MSESIARDLETLEGVACRMPSSNAFVGVLVALADSNIQNQLGMPFDGNEGVAVSEVLVPFPARLGADEHPRGSPCSSGVDKSDLRRKAANPITPAVLRISVANGWPGMELDKIIS